MNENPKSLELLVPEFTKQRGLGLGALGDPATSRCLRLVITYGADPRATGSPSRPREV